MYRDTRIRRGKLGLLGFSCTISFMIVVMLTTSSVTAAQEEIWSKPVELTSIYGGWFPDVTTDEFGRVHVVWAGSVTEAEDEVYDVVMYRRLDPTTGWTEPFDIASLREIDGRAYATRPVLMRDKEGDFHLNYRNERGIHYTYSSREEITGASDWGESQVISSYGYFSEVVEDSAGKLHIIYTTNVPTAECENCFHVFHRFSTNRGISWSVPVDLSRVATGAAKPVVVIDDEDRLHIAWESGYGGDLGQLNGPSKILYAHFDPVEQTWIKPITLSDIGVDSRNVSMAIDRFDRLLVVYLSTFDNAILHRHSLNNGLDWTEKQQVEAVRGAYLTALDRMDMVADAGGGVHLIFIGKLEEQLDVEEEQEVRSIINISWDSLSWSSPEEISRYLGDVPEWPAIAVSEGNRLHVVWFIRDAENIWESDTGNYSVWYASSQTDAPRHTPVAADSIGTPIAGTELPVTDTPESEISPTQVAKTLDPYLLAQPVDAGLVQETDYILLIGKSLIPVAMLLIGIIVFKGIRQV